MFSARDPVAIVAGGPSLTGFDWSRLRGCRVIAVNRAFEVLPDAEVLWWTDSRFYGWHAAAIDAHGAMLKATALLIGDRFRYPASVSVYRFTGAAGYDSEPGCLRHGNNGAFAALSLALKRGARTIALFGVDMRPAPDGRMHWHADHPAQGRETSFGKMLPYWPSLLPVVNAMGATIINASPTSALDVFPRVTHDEAFEYLRRGQ